MGACIRADWVQRRSGRARQRVGSVHRTGIVSGIRREPRRQTIRRECVKSPSWLPSIRSGSESTGQNAIAGCTSTGAGTYRRVQMTEGFIYIAGAFHTVNDPLHGSGGWPIDNDPHFWTDPPTWGICRPDLRILARPGHVIFFVLPAVAQHPQSIFAYLTIDRVVRHFAAYKDPNLCSKRMRPGVPNGNIIVNGSGRYNRLDRGAHRLNFNKIQARYAIGDPSASRLLTHAEVCALKPTFERTLQKVLNSKAGRPIDLISRKGRKLNSQQVADLLQWINSVPPSQGATPVPTRPARKAGSRAACPPHACGGAVGQHPTRGSAATQSSSCAPSGGPTRHHPAQSAPDTPAPPA